MQNFKNYPKRSIRYFSFLEIHKQFWCRKFKESFVNIIQSVIRSRCYEIQVNLIINCIATNRHESLLYCKSDLLSQGMSQACDICSSAWLDVASSGLMKIWMNLVWNGSRRLDSFWMNLVWTVSWTVSGWISFGLDLAADVDFAGSAHTRGWLLTEE